MSFWIESSDEDYETMMVLYESHKNSWSLFIGHFVIEKLLKAFYAKRNRLQPYAPRSHDLSFLADKIGIVLNDEQEKILKRITKFNMETRYGNLQNDFYKKYTDDYTQEQIMYIKEVREWIKNIMII